MVLNAAGTAGHGGPHDAATVFQSVELAVMMWKQGRQTTAELRLATSRAGRIRATPVVTFTSGWITRLLVYPRKFRMSKVVEAFTAVALRTYLLAYSFWPLTLTVRGAFGAFSGFWRLVNSPSGQVFNHPITGSAMYDVAVPRHVAVNPSDGAKHLTGLVAEYPRGSIVFSDPASIEAEAAVFSNLVTGATGVPVARFRLL